MSDSERELVERIAVLEEERAGLAVLAERYRALLEAADVCNYHDDRNQILKLALK